MTTDTKTDYDVLIIGGGIYGCGIAQACTVVGYKTVLVEKNKLASGTSSQSTKLIHGGLRYLEQFNLKLVYEALSERETLLKLAPGLVSKEWFYIPVYKSGRRPAWFIACGLLLYYLLSRGKSRFRWLSKGEWATLPGLNTDGLKAVLAYEDAATDDAALTRAVAASARTMGCEIHEQVAVKSAEYNGSCWQVRLTNGETLTAKMVVNAAGPWVNMVSGVIKPQPPTLEISLVQGSHLLLDRPCPAFIYTESLDGRVMFFRPWRGKTLVGTTETAFEGDPAEVQPQQGEISNILATYNHYFPGQACTEEDIDRIYCGLRVLPKADAAAFFASRETQIVCDAGSPACAAPYVAPYVAVYGGKLTTYRHEAEKVLRCIENQLGKRGESNTKELLLTRADHRIV